MPKKKSKSVVKRKATKELQKSIKKYAKAYEKMLKRQLNLKKLDLAL